MDVKHSIVSRIAFFFYHSCRTIKSKVDASKHGIGADIKITANDNIFIYGSRALNKTGQKYSQLEKELYAIIYGCKHFHHFIYGKKGNVTTDHH